MDKKRGVAFALAVCGGVILGALIDNMFVGLVLGFLVGLGLISWKRSNR
jgi:predicted GNAT superfamily acetyltransferase